LFAPGGLSLVGERGPELVQLPRGSQVFTAAETAGLLGGGKRGYQNTFNITIHAPGGQPAMVATAAEDGVRRAMRAVGIR